MDTANQLAEFSRLIDELRKDEGDMVTIVSDNADFNGQPDCLIICFGDWTGWKERHFQADTLVKCLTLALEARETEMADPPVILPSDIKMIRMLIGCARCGGKHVNLAFHLLDHPQGNMAFWASCPNNGQPILMEIIEVPDAGGEG